MTQFRVLPIRSGDAYLLRSVRGSYLVDGGGPESGLRLMLADRRTRALRAAVCSRVSPGRLCGVLELMEAGYPVGEYWLPEGLATLPRAALAFDGDWSGWRRLVRADADGEEGRTGPVDVRDTVGRTVDVCGGGMSGAGAGLVAGAAMLVALGLAACLDRDAAQRLVAPGRGGAPGGGPGPGGDPVRFLGRALSALAGRAAARSAAAGERERKDGPQWQGEVTGVLRLAGWRLLAGRGPTDLAMLCGRLLLAEAERPAHGVDGGVLRGLALAAMAAARLARTGARLRFFRPVPRLVERLVPRHPLKCLNGEEVEPVGDLPATVSPEGLLRILRRMIDPDNGLVFVYGEAACGALLCGDTRMTFLGRGQPVVLDRPTVVAAPRRGAATAERVYQAVVSGDSGRDVWVRGFLSPTRKVSDGFEAQRVKVCLNNCRTLAMQEILLEFAGGRWNREAGDDCIYA
jgi:hypothetical protein